MSEGHGVQVGDFFVESWGYEQTNITFYKVVGVTAKGVKIQKWSQQRVGDSGEGYYDMVVPGDGPAMEWSQSAQEYAPAPVKLKLVKNHWQATYLNMTSYSNANLWNGTACHQTAAGYGH